MRKFLLGLFFLVAPACFAQNNVAVYVTAEMGSTFAGGSIVAQQVVPQGNASPSLSFFFDNAGNANGSNGMGLPGNGVWQFRFCSDVHICYNAEITFPGLPTFDATAIFTSAITSGGGAGNPAAPGCAFQFSNLGVTAFATINVGGSYVNVDSCSSPTVLNDPLNLSVTGSLTNLVNAIMAGPNPHIDVQAFGARPLLTNPATTCSTTGSGPPYTTINCSSITGFVKGDGGALYAGGAATLQSTPAAPTVTSPVIQGGTQYNYQCVGIGKYDDVTATSPIGSVFNAPTVFGNPPVAANSATWSGGVVTLNFTATFDANFASYAPSTKHVNVVGTGTLSSSINGYWLIASEPSATSLTFSLAGSGSGTFTGTGRATNTFTGAGASRSGQTLTVSTDIASNIQVGPFTNPVIVILTGWLPFDINGEYKLSSNDGDTVSGTTITIKRNALSLTESSTQNGYVTVYEKNVVTCPNTNSNTVKYAVYGNSNPDGTMDFLGFTKYDQRGFTDWGNWIRNGSSGVYRPSWLPSAPPSSAQSAMLETTITNISGSVLTINPGASTAVTSATFLHDDTEGILAAAVSIPMNQNYAGSVVLSPPNSNICTQCPYHIMSPLVMPAGVNLDVANQVAANETTYGGFHGLTIFKDPNGVAQNAGQSFGKHYYAPWIGHGNPLIAFTSDQNLIEGMYFGTIEGGNPADDGQELVHFDGKSEAQYGAVNHSYFSCGVATTSVGLVLVANSDYIDLDSDTFDCSIPWSSNTSGTINWGPQIGALETKGDDNSTSGGQCPSQIYLTGTPQFVGKGWLMNAVSCNTGNYANFTIGSPSGGVDDQQPVTPIIMAQGGVGGPKKWKPLEKKEILKRVL